MPGLTCSFAAAADHLRDLGFAPELVSAPASARESGDALATIPRGAAATSFAEAVTTGGVITAGLPVRSRDPGLIAEAGSRLSAMSAVVTSEGLGTTLSPSHTALLLAGTGATVLSALTCRDRNRVALEGELAALADIGVAGVLAVTGDHSSSAGLPGTSRIGTTTATMTEPVFDLDSPRLAALARRAGLFVAVVERPAAPPSSCRPSRLALKASAGAELVIVDLNGDLADLATFTDALAATGAALPVLVSVPVVTTDAAAVHVATAWAQLVLSAPGVSGVHLSALVDDTDPTGLGTQGLGAVDVLVRMATQLREHLERVPPPPRVEPAA
ncbi:Methylenetetrahydrofolate reductase [Quadrisphaera granulorum]|uniref:Methylene-tetrahydrofolate reductase-like protein n=1 Tax=Quadrisphaera granulorum TaxID=317664 RepID=A0A316A988_9ACTN|nr:methylene-tetrahydrofolate reductase-like protein [Quadrisphaera granulorum]SZE96446.1 Methylenetetrahydrofolate reductase [Quadrisphaera granulorum]